MSESKYRSTMPKLNKLLQKPGIQSWRMILKFIERLEGNKDFEALIEYTCQELESWDDTFREFPGRFYQFVRAKDNSYLLKMCRNLVVDMEVAGKSKKVQLQKMKVLARSENLLNVRQLTLKGFDKELAELLFSSENLDNVKALSLKDCLFEDENGALSFLDFSFSNTLKELELRDCKLTKETLQILADTSQLQDLEVLTLSGNMIGTEVSQYLAESDFLSKFSEVRISRNWFTIEAVIALKQSAATNKVVFESYPNLERIVRCLETPSLESFSNLSRLFETRDFQVNREENIAYLLKRIEEWPASYREYKGPLEDFLYNGNLEARALLYHTLRFTDEYIYYSSLEQLGKLEWIRHIRKVVMNDCHVGDAELKTFAASTGFAALESLELSGNNFGEEGVEALAEAKFPHLKNLNLSCNDLSSNCIQILSESILLEGLVCLDLSDNTLCEDSCKALGKSPALENLEVLYLTDNALEDHELDLLISSPSLKGLKELKLDDNLLTYKGIKALVESDLLEGIRYLDLADNHIDSEGAEILANSPKLKELMFLDLSGNSVSSDGGRALANSLYLRELLHLDLMGNDLAQEDIVVLLSSENVKKLQFLDLSENEVGLEGAKLLAELPHFAQLLQLDLADASIGIEGMKAICHSPNFVKLEALDISGNALGAEGARSLVDSPFLHSLESLAIEYNFLGDEGVSLLTSAPHLQKLKCLELGCNDIGLKGIVAISEAPMKKELLRLKLQDNGVSLSEMKVLADKEAFVGLHSLDVSGNRLAQADLPDLYALAGLRTFESLDLSDNLLNEDLYHQVREQLGKIQELVL